MSFGRPAPYGKFYKGLADDTPVNHDLLWRARVSSEITLIKATEANNAATRAAQQQQERQRMRAIEAAKNKKSYTLEEELELKRVVDREARLNDKENERLKAERRARLAAQQKLFVQRQQRSQLERKVQELEDAYFAGGVSALQSTLKTIGPTGYTARSKPTASRAGARPRRSPAGKR